MNVHHLKCKLGLHDWEYDRHRFDDLVLVEKRCLWCSAEETAASYPIEHVEERREPVRNL